MVGVAFICYETPIYELLCVNRSNNLNTVLFTNKYAGFAWSQPKLVFEVFR